MHPHPPVANPGQPDDEQAGGNSAGPPTLYSTAFPEVMRTPDRIRFFMRPAAISLARVASLTKQATLTVLSTVALSSCTRAMRRSCSAWRTRHDADEFGNNEIDQSAYPDAKPIPVEVPAGSTVSFGAFLVHMSTPNPSDKDRRALLYSYQPAGRPASVEGFRKLVGK